MMYFLNLYFVGTVFNIIFFFMCLEHLLATQRRRPDDKAGTTKDLCHALTLNPVLAPYGKFFIDSKPEGSFLSCFFLKKIFLVRPRRSP
jgi:hypothetical protein